MGIDSSIISSVYQSILESNVRPSVPKPQSDRNWVMKQDDHPTSASLKQSDSGKSGIDVAVIWFKSSPQADGKAAGC